MDVEGNVLSNDVWAKDTTQLRTTDGMCIDDKGNIWVADFSANAVARIDKDGKIQRIAQSPDCDGSDGGLDQPATYRMERTSDCVLLRFGDRTG